MDGAHPHPDQTSRLKAMDIGFIVAEAFQGCSRVLRQRMIYDAVGDMMHKDIHALAIRALTAAEAESQGH